MILHRARPPERNGLHLVSDDFKSTNSNATRPSSARALLQKAGLVPVGHAWRIVFVSPNLGGLWAATEAGLGIVLRTSIGRSRSIRQLKPRLQQPLAGASDRDRCGIRAFPEVRVFSQRKRQINIQCQPIKRGRARQRMVHLPDRRSRTLLCLFAGNMGQGPLNDGAGNP